MTDTFYERMREVAQRLTTKYNTGTITLKRPTDAIQASDAVYTSALAARTYDTYRLDCVVLGVTAEYIKDTTVTMDDLMAITSSYATLVVGSVETPNVVLEYAMTDEFHIDGSLHAIKKIERIPAAGIASGWIIYITK